MYYKKFNKGAIANDGDGSQIDEGWAIYRKEEPTAEEPEPAEELLAVVDTQSIADALIAVLSPGQPTPPATTPASVLRTYLDVSTEHIIEHDAELLAEDALDSLPTNVKPNAAVPETKGLIVYAYAEGFWVYCFVDPADPAAVAERETAMAARGYSAALLNLLRLAGKMGCTFLNLDSDGTVHDAMPKFHWYGWQAGRNRG